MKRTRGSSPRETVWRKPVLLGLLVGASFGLWNLIATRLNPLAEDTPRALLVFYGPMFAAWGLAGFAVTRRTGRVFDGAKVGATVACATFVMYVATQFVRVNVFLDVISQRSDWQDLMARFRESGSGNLRWYANYVGLTGAPFKILVATMIGAGTGLLGGFLGTLGRHERARSASRLLDGRPSAPK
jgi:hypothetical protein